MTLKEGWVIRIDDPEMDSPAYFQLGTGFNLTQLKHASLFDNYDDVLDYSEKLIHWNNDWLVNEFKVYYLIAPDGAFDIVTDGKELDERFARLEEY